MESTTHLNSNSGNEELMAYYRAECRNANGEAVGTESDTPEAAAEREGWTVLRHIGGRGNAVLAERVDGILWIVADNEGPWGVEVR